MFGTKKLRDEVEALKEKIKSQETVSVAICDTCGCLVELNRAIKGKSEIKTRKKYNLELAGSSPLWRVDEEYIHTPYYCGRCAPKEEKAFTVPSGTSWRVVAEGGGGDGKAKPEQRGGKGKK